MNNQFHRGNTSLNRTPHILRLVCSKLCNFELHDDIIGHFFRISNLFFFSALVRNITKDIANAWKSKTPDGTGGKRIKQIVR